MRVRLLHFPGNSYSSWRDERWRPGEVRELADDHSAYLLATFPEHFAVEPAPEPEPASGAPATGPEPAKPSIRSRKKSSGGP